MPPCWGDAAGELECSPPAPAWSAEKSPWSSKAKARWYGSFRTPRERTGGASRNWLVERGSYKNVRLSAQLLRHSALTAPSVHSVLGFGLVFSTAGLIRIVAPARSIRSGLQVSGVLDIPPRGALTFPAIDMQRLLMCLLVSAVVSGAQGSVFLRIWPEKPVVEFGGFVVINCTTNYQNTADLGVETSLTKESVPESGTSWKAFRLLNVTDWTPRALCYLIGEDLDPLGANITVYRAPNHVVLDPLPKVEVGKEYNLTCRVFDVAPIRNITVTFFRGGEKLHQETFEEHSNATAEDLVVTHRLTAQQADHGVEFSCHAALDLRPEAELFEKASHNQSLGTVVFSVDPHLQTSQGILESNTEMHVKCDVAGVFPAEDAQFDLTFAGESLNFSISVLGDRVTAEAQVSPSSVGVHELICTVSLGPVTRTALKTVHIYSLPQPTISHQEIFVNQTVTITCRSQGAESPGTTMQIRDTKQILKSGGHGPLHVNVTAQEEDDGREFTCEVSLVVDGQTVLKNTSVKLTVFYGPQMNDSSCPKSFTWKEGSEETFICSAWGNPAPTVECSKDNMPYVIGIQQHITKEQDGIYRCNATNVYGSVVQWVTVRVEVHQLDTLGISLAVLCVVVVASAAVVAYKMYYRAHKIRKYRLKKQQTEGTAMETKCLNGNAPTL